MHTYPKNPTLNEFKGSGMRLQYVFHWLKYRIAEVLEIVCNRCEDWCQSKKLVIERYIMYGQAIASALQHRSLGSLWDQLHRLDINRHISRVSICTDARSRIILHVVGGGTSEDTCSFTYMYVSWYIRDIISHICIFPQNSQTPKPEHPKEVYPDGKLFSLHFCSTNCDVVVWLSPETAWFWCEFLRQCKEKQNVRMYGQPKRKQQLSKHVAIVWHHGWSLVAHKPR